MTGNTGYANLENNTTWQIFKKQNKQKTIRIKKQNEKINERDHVRCYTFTEEKQQCIMSRKSFKMFTEDPLLSRVTKNTKKFLFKCSEPFVSFGR